MKKRIRCGTLFTGLEETARQDQEILVDDGVIEYAGPREQAPESTACEVVDYSRLFVLPGLIDYHAHLAYGNAKCEEDIDLYAPVEFRALRGLFLAQRALAAGFTSLCDPGTASRVTLSIRDAINAHLFRGPRITAAGPYITSRQGVTDWYPTWIGQPETSVGHVVRSSDEAIEEIRCQIKDGVDVIKLAMDGRVRARFDGTSRFKGLLAAFSQDELNRMTAEAHRLGRRVITHARGKEAALYSARSGVDVINHASYADEECLEEILRYGCAVCPSLTLLANVYEFSQPADGASRWADVAKQEFDTACENLARAHKAGVPMLVGTDSGFAFTPFGEWHAKEIVLFVRHLGMTPAAAIRCATVNAAPYLVDGHRLGAIEAGRHADLLVLDGNPLHDIGHLLDRSRFKAVLLAGAEVPLGRVDYDPRLVSDFSYASAMTLYTQARVSEMSKSMRSIAAE